MSKLIYPFGVLRVFFSLRCNFSCGYCSMRSQPDLWKGEEFTKDEVAPDQWIRALERIESKRRLVVTPCNAEPAIYEGCHEIINKGLNRFHTQFYTNLSTASREEIARFDKRDNLSFYVSYHTGQMDIQEFIDNAKWLQANYNVINFHAPMYPPFKQRIERDAVIMKEQGVLLDTTHEYLGMYKGKMHYSYLLEGKKEPGEWLTKRMANSLEGKPKKKVLCKTSFDQDSYFSRAHTVAPDGDVYTCWRFLYNHDKRGVLGSFFDPEFQFKDEYFECDQYGDCNICAWHKNIKDPETGEQLDIDTADKAGKTISACMIVKNEEELLPDCLASIKDWVHEIVIVDTGSSDRTIEIAKENGAVVYEMEWKDDFAKARNYSISKATEDWIFIIDADERVAPGDGQAVRQMLAETKYDVVAVDVLNVRGPEGIIGGRSPGLRFFRRSYKPSYVQSVHNKAVIARDTVIYRVPFRIYHLGYDLSPEVMAEKYDRRIKMCRKLVEDQPNVAESWYHYARALKVKNGEFNGEQKELIIESLEKGIKLCNGENDPQNIYIQLLTLMAWIRHIVEDHKEAIHYAKRALIFKHDHLDAILVIGMAYTYGVSADNGERWLKRYLQEQEIYDFSSKLDSIAMEHGQERVSAYKALIDIEKGKNDRRMEVALVS